MKSKMKDTLLLIGDASSDRSNLHAIFEPHYYLLEAETAAQGIQLLKQNSPCIAAVLADIPLSDPEDLKSLVEASHPSDESGIPVIALVSHSGTGQREEMAFLLGAADVMHKPYTNLSVQRRVQVLVDLYAHQWHLEALVEEQSNTIRHTNQTMVDTLSAIIEHRNSESGNHVLRIRRFTQILLHQVAANCPEYRLNDQEIDRISTASSLHDIGKISIPDLILNKPGPLTTEEFEIMKTHTTVGSQLVEQIGDVGDPMYLRYIYNICLSHHERWDGKGYPQGLKGNEIPICAQVVGLADAYDALTTPRVYKPAYPHAQAVNMILNGECGTFSPILLECFKRVRGEFEQLSYYYTDGNSPKSDHIRIPLPAPSQESHTLNAVQLSHLKYQTLLHHLNDTVIEFDLAKKNYHVVHNPNPDFLSFFSNTSFEEISRQLITASHPDGDVEVLQKQIVDRLFHQNHRKYTFRCPIYSHLYDKEYPHEITLLRVNTGIPEQQLLIAILHPLTSASEIRMQENPASLPEADCLYNLSSSLLRCVCDDALTITQGSQMLFPLTGFSAEQIRQQFGNSLRNLILPEDRNLLDIDRSPENGLWEANFRLQRKNEAPLWVLCKGRSFLTEGGQEACYILLTDNTAGKEQELWLESRAACHASLVELSEGIILEWDAQGNLLSGSDRWEQRFGYPLRKETLTGDLNSLTHVHPDDMPLVRKKRDAILFGNQADSIELRIANSEGRYLWSRIRVQAIQDREQTSQRITAIIYDIDELKQDALNLKKQAETDPLTKLMNKNSAQAAIMEYLSQRKAEKMAALLVLDLDNFKDVNDTLGHLYGDAVLSQIGTKLRDLFRPQDVIGRIGGDEFIILMQDIPSKELVLERCQLLVDTFQELLHRLMPKLKVSMSIGAALAPAHGTNYADLFRHADDALYAAKRAGKCQYHLYDDRDAYQVLNGAMSHTRIDSDEQPSMNSEDLIRFVFRRLYESRNMEETIIELLAFIGAQFNISRVYIFENNDDNTACSNTFEWCNEGILPEKDNLQDLSYLTDLVGWPDVYKENGVLYCSDINELEPHIRQIVEPQGIKSMLHCAILDQGVFRGYVGFDECTANYLWTQNQVDTLQFLAEVLAVFLIKQRAADKD